MAYFPNTPTAAKLTEDLSFKTQQGTRGPVVKAGTDIKVRYNEREGYFTATAVVDGKPVTRKDIPLRAFDWS
jgi:hypothetical protein